jgi:hypothetical protein
MKRQEGQKFAAKHEATAKIDQRIKDQLDRRAKNKKLPCAVAFKITDDINVSPAEVGKTADLLEIELVKCQLGLFGYTPEKKIVKPKTSQNQDLESAIGVMASFPARRLGKSPATLMSPKWTSVRHVRHSTLK